MKVSRKMIIAELAILEKKLQYHQAIANAHKTNLNNLLNMHHVFYFIMLLPAFVWGWKQGRTAKLWASVNALIDLGKVYAFSHLKRQLLVLL